MLRSFGKPVKGSGIGCRKRGTGFSRRGPSGRGPTLLEAEKLRHIRKARAGRHSLAEVAGHCGRGPEPRLSSQTEELLVNAALLLVTTAWLAGADQPAPPAATVAPPAATS